MRGKVGSGLLNNKFRPASQEAASVVRYWAVLKRTAAIILKRIYLYIYEMQLVDSSYGFSRMMAFSR